MSVLLVINLSVSFESWLLFLADFTIDLGHELRTERAGLLELLDSAVSLGEVLVLSWEHPLLVTQDVVFASDNEGQVSELLLALASDGVLGGGDAHGLELVRRERWHRHQAGSGVESDEALSALAEAS